MPSVRMKTTSCGPDGNRFANKVYPVTAEEGAALVAGGFASWVEAPTGEPVIETATIEPRENAARTPVRKRRQP